MAPSSTVACSSSSSSRPSSTAPADGAAEAARRQAEDSMASTVIGAGITIEGEVTSDEDVVVQGHRPRQARREGRRERRARRRGRGRHHRWTGRRRGHRHRQHQLDRSRRREGSPSARDRRKPRPGRRSHNAQSTNSTCSGIADQLGRSGRSNGRDLGVQMVARSAASARCSCYAAAAERRGNQGAQATSSSSSAFCAAFSARTRPAADGAESDP